MASMVFMRGGGRIFVFIGLAEDTFLRKRSGFLGVSCQERGKPHLPLFFFEVGRGFMPWKAIRQRGMELYGWSVCVMM